MSNIDETQLELSINDSDKRYIVSEAAKAAKAAVIDRDVLDGVDSFLSDDEREALVKDRKNFKAMDYLFRNNGKHPSGRKRFTLEELMEKDRQIMQDMGQFSTDNPLLVPRVLSNMVREAIEPNMVLTNLLTRINFSYGTSITFPAFGTMGSASKIAEGAEYPEIQGEMGGEIVSTIGKYGIAFKVSEEMLRYSQLDVMGMYARACGRALARLKEETAAELITADYGNVIFDNQNSAYRTTTGRDASGAYNGTITLDDFFYAYAQMIDRGFNADTLIFHPLAWQIFAESGISRAFGFEHGMAQMMWQNAQGSIGSAPQWRVGGLNQQTVPTSPGTLATTYTNLPSIFPSTFKIVVSPYMPYNTSTNRTDIVFADSREMGLLVVDEEVVSDEWTDKARDLHKVKFRERWDMQMINNGEGIAVFKNIKIGKNYDFQDRLRVNIDATGLGSPLSGDGANTANA